MCLPKLNVPGRLTCESNLTEYIYMYIHKSICLAFLLDLQVNDSVCMSLEMKLHLQCMGVIVNVGRNFSPTVVRGLLWFRALSP